MKNGRIFWLARAGNGELVAYLSGLPLSDSAFEKILKPNFNEKDLTDADIRSYDEVCNGIILCKF